MSSNGGQAFPKAGDDERVATEGMTLRDYFAAHAMAALLSQHVVATDQPLYETDDPQQASSLAYLAYKAADAMLAARET